MNLEPNTPEPAHESIDTRCVRPDRVTEPTTRPLVPGIEWSVVYEFRDLDHVDAVYGGTEAGYVYARDGHPGAARLGAQIAALEAAEAAMATSSGMAAEAALFLGLLRQGDHITLGKGLYGRTQVLVAQDLARFGVDHSIFDPCDPDTWTDGVTLATKLCFVETITNPLVRVPDLPRLAEFCQSRGVALAVDNTFAPLIARPIAMGAAYVTHSVTKMIAGHSDATIGALAGSVEAIAAIRPAVSSFGMTANPFECALALRGMATLPLRFRKACENAQVLAEFLELHSQVDRVHYPGLKSHVDYRIASQILEGGFGTIMTIDLGSREAANRFIRRLQGRIPFAPSLGDVMTTLSHPVTTSHRGLTEAQRLALGITPGLVRLSIGIEDAADLRADFEMALGV
ncbi:Cys/Met metabolism pyridoxal-phosphate-dependent protein [bacterium]|nr:Cys/Met metabolism pyridoxal-phosphate-dependent protein [bacterium]